MGPGMAGKPFHMTCSLSCYFISLTTANEAAQSYANSLVINVIEDAKSLLTSSAVQTQGHPSSEVSYFVHYK